MTAETTPGDRYQQGLFSFDAPTELLRLQLRQRIMDPDTHKILAARGLQPHWRCLELGAGTGSIARWLAERCGDGQVTATDIDIRYLKEVAGPNLHVHRHDVVKEDFPPGSFDLVHARAVLSQLPARDEVLPKIAAWVAPGGWLVIEDPVFFMIDSSPYPPLKRLMTAFEQHAAMTHGANVRWPRRLPALMPGLGLDQIGMSLQPQYTGDGGRGGDYWRVPLNHARPGMVAHGLLTEEEFAEGLALFDDPSVVDIPCTYIAVWARRPRA